MFSHELVFNKFRHSVDAINSKSPFCLFILKSNKKLRMKRLEPVVRLQYSITILLLLFNAGQVLGQDSEHYSEFRKKFSLLYY